MNQITLGLDAQPVPARADAVDRVGFDIGWDHAHHGLVPPPELLLDGTPLSQGWLAGKAVFGRRSVSTQRSTRQWLALRILAWRHRLDFEVQQLTPQYLAQIEVDCCPILRMALSGTPGQADCGVIDRVEPQGGYAAGNVVCLSLAAAQAREGVPVLEALRRGHRAAATGEAVEGLDAAAWWRLAALRSFATALPFHETARIPLAVLPPPRVRLLNPAQGLQALLTLQFAAPGWAQRTRAIADLLPAHTLRHDFNLFIGALAPRVIEAERGAAALRLALEDAWLHERVQRRWQHLVLSLGEAATAALIDRAAADGLAGVRTQPHAPQQHDAGRAQFDDGRTLPRTPRPVAAAPWQRRAAEAGLRPAP